MSLLNLIVHPDRAYLITDSGHYARETGVVTRLGPKSMVLETVRLVLGTAGSMHCAHLAGVLRGRDRSLSQAQFIAELPSIAREAMDTYRIDQGTVIAFAGYSQALQAPFGEVFAIDPDRCGHVRPHDVWLSPSAECIDKNALADPSFNPLMDIMPLIEQQRLFNFGSPDQPICGIAGEIDVVTVHAGGFGERVIHRYPAAIGDKVSFEDGSWPPSASSSELAAAQARYLETFLLDARARLADRPVYPATDTVH